MHGGLALHTLLPLTDTHTQSNLPPPTYTQLKLTELKGSGWNRLVVPSKANAHPLAKRWKRWQWPLSANAVYSLENCPKRLAGKVMEADALSIPIDKI